MAYKKRAFLDCNFLNFTECDRCILNLLHDHLRQPENNNLECSKIRQITRQFKQALEQGGIISLAVDGQVQFMTQRAEQLLSQYFDFQDSHTLPVPLKNWCKHKISQLTSRNDLMPPFSPLKIEKADRQLIIHFILDLGSKKYLLLLEEQELSFFSINALELLGLTRREAEVLFWVGKDKNNAGIARVLTCCEGTVRKHLENTYKKLGVQTRTGAVMVALEKLGIIKR